MAKIVVLGSTGQLGSDVIEVFLNGNHQVIAVTKEQVDATSLNVIEQLAHYSDAAYIINCIATTNVDGCEEDPDAAFKINSTFVYLLAKFCNQNNIVLIHVSTDYVFDGAKKHAAYSEHDVPCPLNVYGLSKYAGELAIMAYAQKYFILRVASLFGVAGASGKGGNFVTTMLRLAKEKDEWTVIDDQITCPTHTMDIAKAIKSLVDNSVDEYGIFNCVSSGSCSWFEFTREILQQNGYNPDKVKPISYKDYQFKAKRPQYGILNNDKISKYYKMPDYKNALQAFFERKKTTLLK